jgi:hypothetical protein
MNKALRLIVLIALTGNSFTQTAALPDLKIELRPMSFKHTKYPWFIDQSEKYRLSPGDVAEIAVAVSNSGQAASGPFTVEIALDKQVGPSLGQVMKRYKVFTKKIGDLKPGERTVLYQDYEIDAPDGDIRCELNIIAMQVRDWNDNDNMQHCGTILYWQQKFVSDYLRPDLAVELSSPDATRHLTLPVRLVAKVTNNGPIRSRSTDLVLKCKEKKDKTVSVPPLKPGESFSHTFEHKWYTLGTKNCRATVNASGRIDDKDVQNNSAEMAVYIK